jgi:serine/threonine protein kinase
MADEKPTPDPGLPENEASAYLAAGFLVGGGRFSLLRELGQGGMGLVWLAHDERLMTPVALKFLPEAVRANPVALNDLRQETNKSRMLSHPNIIRIYDLYEAPDEAAFISMEYVDGPNLWAMLSQQPKGFFYWDYLKPIVKQLCEALDYAHSESVIHRDLKPANMLLDERHRLRLADFGIATWAFASPVNDTERHRTSGTLSYMSPQQIDGQAARVTDDIYALGATLYELLSGHPPFYQNDIAYQVRNVLATPLSDRLADLEVENDVPPAVAAMIMACLSKNPEKRPQSARAVAEWIGFTESTALPMTSFASTVFTAPETSGTAKEPKKTAAAPAPATEIVVPPPARENAAGRRLAMLVGAAGLGILAWLAWGHFIPKTPNFSAPLSAPKTTAVDSTGADGGTTAQSLAPAPPLSGTSVIPAVDSAGISGSKTAPALTQRLAPAPLLSGTTVSIELGGVNRQRGLQEVTGVEDGTTSPANIAGKDCRLLESRPRGRCYFLISSAFKRAVPMNARIQVEYYAAAPGFLQIQFDGSSRQTPHYTNGGRVNFQGDGVWKTANYQINEALFHNGENGGADFRLTTTSRALYIHSVTVFFDE